MLHVRGMKGKAYLGLRRDASAWLGGLMRKLKRSSLTEEEGSQKHQEEADYLTLAPEEVLGKIAQDHLPAATVPSWREADLGDKHLKAKILSHFERDFRHSISNQELSSINTFADLLSISETLQQQQQDQQQKTTVFPNICDDGTLPPNLSIQFINTTPRPKPHRKPFQNFDARRPEHASFLSKAERERRKLKGRHLTAAQFR